MTSLKRDYDASLREFQNFTTEIVKSRLRSWNVSLTPTKQNFGKLALIDLLIDQEEGQSFENRVKNIREQVSNINKNSCCPSILNLVLNCITTRYVKVL